MFSKIFKKSSSSPANDTEEHDPEKCIAPQLPSINDCVYTSCYCEENIWHLCKNLEIDKDKKDNECYCVFLSNSRRAVHLWKQKLCGKNKDYVIWDYHVFAIYGKRKTGYWVLDFDTQLSFPVTFKDYVKEALKTEDGIMPDYRRYFRVIPAKEYLKYFSSDRRHMKIGESWSQPPPKYAPIIAVKEHPHNLDEFIDMTKGKGHGEVLNYDEFVKKFS